MEAKVPAEGSSSARGVQSFQTLFRDNECHGIHTSTFSGEDARGGLGDTFRVRSI